MSERGGVLQGNFIENFLIKISFVKQIKKAFILYIYRCCRNPKKNILFLHLIYNFYQRLSKAVYMTQWSVPTESSILTLPSNFLHDMDWSYSIFQLKSRHHPQSESDSRTDLHTAGYSVWHSI